MITKIQVLLVLALSALVIRAPAAATGTVVDAKGQPVAGATVEFYRDTSAVTFMSQDLVRKESATTDDKGAFSIAADSGVTVALVKKEGLAPGWKMFTFALGESEDPITLTAPAVLAGTVVDEAGNPVAEAEVWVSTALQVPQGSPMTQKTMTSLIMGKPAHENFATHTTADGHFRIANFPANAQASLAVRKAGLTLRSRANFNGGLPYASGREDIKLTMEKAGIVEGKVTVQGTGQPLAGAKVSSGGLGINLLGLEGNEPVVTGTDGAFRLVDVPPGKLLVAATFPSEKVPDWVANNVSINVTGGETTKGVIIKASKGGVAAITVSSQSDHKPVPQAMVVVYNQDGQNPGSTITGADGKVQIRLSPGDWMISVSKEGWGQAQSTVSAVEGQTNQVEIELSAGLRINGTIRDTGGSPIAGVNVSVNPNYGNNRPVKTDASGHYEIAWQKFNLGGNQTFSLMARSAERNLAATQDIEESTTKLDLKLQPGLTLTATVQDAKGKVVTNATATAFLVNNSSWGGSGITATTDARGHIEIAAMPAADGYSLSVSAKGYGSAQQQLPAPAKSTARLDFSTMVLPLANLKLAGKVLGTDGKPAASVMVQFFGQNQPNGNTQTDAEGRFAFDGVCEGPIQLNANSEGTSAGAQAVGGDTNVVLTLEKQNFGTQWAGAQGTKITGVVRDTSGKPAVGVRVKILPVFGMDGETKTDSDGKYSINWQKQNNGMQFVPLILARDLDHDLAAAQDLDDSTTNVDLLLKPGLTLAIKVLDAKGKPIPDATGFVNLWTGNMGTYINQIPTKADEGGLIEIKGLPQDRRYSLHVTAKGYGSSDPQLASTDTQTTRYDFPTAILRVADRKLAGQVLGADGKPAVGAYVNLNGAGQPNGNTTTDAKGHFSFEAVCEGPLQLYANGQGGGNMFGSVQAQGGDTNVVIHFGINGMGRNANAQMVTTTGKVLDASGAPAAGVRLMVAGGNGGSMNTEIRSDADGKYSITWQFQNTPARAVAAARRGGAPAAQYLLVARDIAGNQAVAEEITEKSTSLDLHLQPGLTISGSVVDLDGKPVHSANVTLFLMTARMSSTIGPQQPTTVDADGGFSIAALPQNQHYMVYVNASGYGSPTRDVPAGETQTVSYHLPTINLKLANMKLEGQVVDANDKPLSGATVQINGTDQPNDNVTTDSKGHFVFNHVCEGPVRVFAYNDVRSGNTQAQGGDVDVTIKIGANQRAGAVAAIRQAPPRVTPPKPQPWAMINLRTWPAEHRTAIEILLGTQAAALLAAAGAIFWFTRRKSG